MKRTGCVAFIDAIGFKGIWRRSTDPGSVLSRLNELRSFVESLIDQENSAASPPVYDMRFEMKAFSDTLAFLVYLDGEIPPEVAQADPEGFLELRKYLLLKNCVMLMSRVIGFAITDKELPFLYRGSIAMGDFYYNSFAFVGPAVDEAGSYFEQAEGAFVYLCPSALTAVESRPGTFTPENFPFAVKYDVPLKNDVQLSTYAVNPLLFSGCIRSLDGFFDPASEVILDFIGGSPQQKAKRDNTEKFLKFTRENYVPF